MDSTGSFLPKWNRAIHQGDSGCPSTGAPHKLQEIFVYMVYRKLGEIEVYRVVDLGMIP